MTFELPLNVTAQRKPISVTSYEYVLRHNELGQLGRILLSATPGHCSLLYEVHGESHQRITAMRREVFEPLVKSMYSGMVQSVGPGLLVSMREYDPAGNQL